MNRWLLLLIGSFTAITLVSATHGQNTVRSGIAPSSGPAASAQDANARLIRDCADCPELIRVDGVGRDGRALLVGRYELLWHEYMQSVIEGGCVPPANMDGRVLPRDPGATDRYPITTIRPAEIQCYLSWISKKSKKTYRLPTEREWITIAELSGVTEADTVRSYSRNKALLSNLSTPYWGLSANDLSLATVVPGEEREAILLRTIGPVGTKAADRLGLYDLIGNLPEMIADLPAGTPAIAFNRPVVAKKGAGLGTTDPDFNLLHHHEKTIASWRGYTVGYRVVRSE